jgi:GTP-binding protein HflX
VLRKRLKDLKKQRATQRKERRRAQVPTVALAGYTNVGKSTLLNVLTGSDVSVENRLFETLDATTRGFDYDGRRYLLTDTVGFIRRLPTQLVEGFASTLEETLLADMVLHVVDASSSDDEQDRQVSAVNDVLHEIGAGELPIEIVLNKIDRVDPLGRRRLANRFPGAPQVSALTGEGIDELKAELARRFEDRWERVRLLLPYADGDRLSELYALGTPIEERKDTEAGVLLIARLPRRDLPRFAPYLIADSAESGRETA